ncbi:putative GEM-like protein 5 [Iris pallida]|uniref:GEM-like protein 5 n=1 Tax=Iris pallida TaxID=29817 RepID=A0AAX6H980_IRIPA|nr:putative GEM-like protein 5 [Iris pallida]
MATEKTTEQVTQEEALLGTKQMGPPSAPAAHPQNGLAARLGPERGERNESPYVLWGEPAKNQKPSPMEHILEAFNSWTHKAETLASNVWGNLKTAPSMTDAAWGKLNLTAKAISEGGFESLYKQTFPTEVSERLKKTFACYLSTSTGPVAGTLYLSTHALAFCSDRPLSFTAPSGQVAWSYYKVAIPLAKVEAVSPVAVKEDERYVQVTTVDGHEFWFMGFVNYDKAVTHLLDAVSDSAAARAVGASAAPEPAVAQ